MSPVGWLRANTFLDRLSEYPPKGSLQETALLLTYFKRQEAVLLRDTAIIQALNPSKAAIDRFEEYRSAAFPFVQHGQEQEQERLEKALEEVRTMGPMMIEPLQTETKKRRRR